MTRDELIEAMARAIYSEEGFVHDSDDRMFEPVIWEEADDDDYQCVREGYRRQARAALAAIEEQGLAIVPVEATMAMLNHFSGTEFSRLTTAKQATEVKAYSAMIDAGKM